jgi:hypothetical protein
VAAHGFGNHLGAGAQGQAAEVEAVFAAGLAACLTLPAPILGKDFFYGLF